ncbi:MAG: ParB/RepB/Spo0J family partition protein [Fimbriimonadaceae bacterium]|nr:ParB/RepB/Spo0J family partition protein [Fimbriimonadaceae bacterium]QYK57194.1 MAG: ParB/RepB/Spo0J family partition protein [Fimbriimonadaceae bacterium]
MRRALGKGLSQLLGDESEVAPSQIEINRIVANPRQPRAHIEDETLSELAASIGEHGVIQPLIVRPLSEGRYELIAGERRLRAAKMAGLKAVPVVVRTASAQVSLELALIENVQREDISAVDCARAYRRLADEFGLTQEDIALKVGKTRASVSNTLRLLRLPAEVLSAIEGGQITEGHARALLMVDSPARQAALFERMLRDSISVREAESAARREEPAQKRTKTGAAKHPKSTDPNLEAIERGLGEYFGATVRLEPGAVGGKISIDYYSDDDLDRILEILGFRI